MLRRVRTAGAGIAGFVVAGSLLVGVTAGMAQAAPRPAPEPVPAGVSVAAANDRGPLEAAMQQARPMVQGGFDRDHWWFKISRTELVTIGAGAACAAVFDGPAGLVVCPPLVAALNWAIGQFPVANGFWGEVYTNGRVRVGTW